jgi:hypothetical protein
MLLRVMLPIIFEEPEVLDALFLHSHPQASACFVQTPVANAHWGPARTAWIVANDTIVFSEFQPKETASCCSSRQLR